MARDLSSDETFKASKGWYERFARRHADLFASYSNTTVKKEKTGLVVIEESD